jgi:hypothetical protein
MKLNGRLRIVMSAGGMLFLCGCPNPNTYGVPRTLDPGGVQFTVAPEVYGINFKGTSIDQNGNVTTTRQSAYLPTVPSVGLHIGIVDGFELGLRAPNLDSLGLDGKVQLVRGGVDLAVDPGVQVASLLGIGLFYLHLPVLIGVNLSEKVTLVATPGILYALASGTPDATSNTAQQGVSATQLFGRLGLGVDVRVAKKVALHPELTFLKGFASNDAVIFVFGFGVNLGAMPNYSDLGGAKPAAGP